jgi:ketosteroid isomerase-like protein
MADYPNAEPIRQAFDAFARGDMATMQSLVAEDTVWHIPGRGPLAGDHHNYKGQDAWIFELRDGQIAEAWWRPEDVYAADEFWT